MNYVRKYKWQIIETLIFFAILLVMFLPAVKEHFLAAIMTIGALLIYYLLWSKRLELLNCRFYDRSGGG